MTESPKYLSREPKIRVQIRPTLLVDDLLNILGDRYQAKRHMQTVPPYNRLQAALAGLASLGQVTPVAFGYHEVVPMVRIVKSREANQRRFKKKKKVIELYGPAYVSCSVPVTSITGIGEHKTFTGSSIFVPPETLPDGVTEMLSRVSYLNDSIRYRVITNGQKFNVEKS